MTPHTKKGLGPAEVEARISATPMATRKLAQRFRQEAPELLKAAYSNKVVDLTAIATKFGVSIEDAHKAVFFNVLINRHLFFKNASKKIEEKKPRPAEPSAITELITLANISSLRSGDTILYEGGGAINKGARKSKGKKNEYQLSGRPYCNRHGVDRQTGWVNACTCTPARPNTIALSNNPDSPDVVVVDVEQQAAYRIIPKPVVHTP